MIRLRDLRVTAGQAAIVDGISLDIPSGQFLALLGPSGSGKTSLLRAIAGLVPVAAGTVEIDGRDFTALSPGGRQIGFVFQSYALFGHMTVFENVAFGLRVRPRRERPREAEIRDRVGRMLDLVRLAGLDRRLPSQLSGGQRQRVALARALAIEPRILLLDEPFGALDQQVRDELRLGLRRVHDELGITTLFVSHDQEEALALADRIVMLETGRVVADEPVRGVEAGDVLRDRRATTRRDASPTT